MPEITPEQREAAWQAIRKWTAAIGSGPQDPDYALDALIAAGWGPVAAAEARGYRAGLEDAAKECDGIAGNDRDFSRDYRRAAGHCAFVIRALADKPKEDHHG